MVVLAFVRCDDRSRHDGWSTARKVMHVRFVLMIDTIIGSDSTG